MIKKITIQNFFSFGSEQTIELNSDTNVLVGINGTGKSNFIKAIRFLQQGIKGNFGKLFSEKWGGFSGASNFINPEANEIKLSFYFDAKEVGRAAKVANFDGVISEIEIIYQIRIVKNGLVDYQLYEEVIEGNTKIDLDEKLGLPDNGRKELRLAWAGSVLGRPLSLFLLYKSIEQISIYDYFDTSFESEIRQLSPYFSEEKLLSDGRNLTALLSHLSGNSIKVYDRIKEEILNINPNFKDLIFTTPIAGKSLLSLKESNLDKAITIEHISDGTLKYLLLLSIFYNPNRGSVICIDEPENGLHPDMINGIARGIKYAAQNGTQMIIATHSPLLLNSFELEDLKIFEKDQKNQTVVKVKSEEDFPDWEGEFLAGQMWLRGQIGGTRW
ncbi:Predicted ATPase [Pseudarcicella hirudinis]|uniref:Predicted ATPase n=1 Tax=Pseudarcicella hirudinis TaxID=1079859 RepID=A0A1I5NRA9_9BACT|nr:AAA family ATPase [Pseudarcicella hirudinis]SFP23771.1 Predicted ATPase [Pseudarcicella hirudinis]